MIVFVPLLLGIAFGLHDVEASRAAGVVLPPGARIHLEPDVMSTSISVVDEEVELEPLERRDGWVLVRYAGFQGWVRTSGSDEPLTSARGGRPALPAGPPPPDLVAEGRALLRDGGREIVLERWQLLTDVEDGALLERLQALAVAGPKHFQTWWRLPIVPASGPTLILFGRPEAAKGFDSVACGRIGSDLATASVVEGDADATVRRVLHQLGHLHARALVGPKAPPWLEEGLADSFAALAEHGPGLQEPVCPATRRFDCVGVEPTPLSAVLGAKRELFGNDEVGASLRLGARRFCRYFWNGGSVGRTEKLRRLVGDVRKGQPLDRAQIEKRLGATVPTLEMQVRSYREALPGAGRSPKQLGAS